MSVTSAKTAGQPAPCGQIVEAERREDRDTECLLTYDVQYACGCRSISHEYHDGAVSRKVVRHDGVVLVDELFTAA
jgi:hypothetical protein